MSQKPKSETQESERHSSRISLDEIPASSDTVRMRAMPELEEKVVEPLPKKGKNHTMESRAPAKTLDERELALFAPPEQEENLNHTLSMESAVIDELSSLRDSSTLQEYTAGVGARDSLTSIGKKKPLVPVMPPPPSANSLSSKATMVEGMESTSTFYEGNDPATLSTFYGGNEETAADLEVPSSLRQEELFEDGGKTDAHEIPGEAFREVVSEEQAAFERLSTPSASGDTFDPRQTVLPRLSGSEEGIQLISEGRGRFEELKSLGSGSMGDVSLVADNDIQRYVAVKRLKNSRKKAQVARFVKEVQVVGQLEHPNIIPIHDVGRDLEGNYFFVMKYVEGETMGEIIKKMRAGDKKTLERFPPSKRFEIFLQLLYAIQFAHKQNIIHRDLKPDNIMIGEFGEVQVMDWGIATRLEQEEANSSSVLEKQTMEMNSASRAALESLGSRLAASSLGASITRQGALLGTPAYMAPEQILGYSKANKQTDLYSLNVLFYEWLTLKHYLESKLRDVHSLLFAIAEEKPLFASKVHSPYQDPVSAELSHFLEKGLQKEPAKRFQTVEDMIKHLEWIAKEQAPIQCAVTFNRRLLSAMRNLLTRRHMTGVIAMMLMVMLMGMGFWKLYDLFRILLY